MSSPKWLKKAEKRSKKKLAAKWANPVKAEALLSSLKFLDPVRQMEQDAYVQYGILTIDGLFKHGWQIEQFSVTAVVPGELGVEKLDDKKPETLETMRKFLEKFLRRRPILEFRAVA